MKIKKRPSVQNVSRNFEGEPEDRVMDIHKSFSKTGHFYLFDILEFHMRLCLNKRSYYKTF